jgi:hypothetical protein
MATTISQEIFHVKQKFDFNSFKVLLSAWNELCWDSIWNSTSCEGLLHVYVIFLILSYVYTIPDSKSARKSTYPIRNVQLPEAERNNMFLVSIIPVKIEFLKGTGIAG